MALQPHQSTLPDDKRLRILAFAHMAAGSATIGSETYKDKLYLVVNLGESDTVYNELKLNQAARVAKVMNEKLLTVLKALASPIADVAGIYGLKIEFQVPHRNFLNAGTYAETDKLEAYVPADAVKKFADADITSQQLVDGSVVIVNDNRVQVGLSEQ